MRNLVLYFIFSIFGSLKLSREPRVLIKQIGTFVVLASIAYYAYTSYVDKKDSKLLMAASRGDVEGIDAAISNGSNVYANDIVGRTALHLAARYNKENAVLALLKQGASPDIKDYKGRTPLHIAYFDQTNNVETIKTLLSYNANPNIVDNDGNTPLDLALKRRKYSAIIAKLLRKNGAMTGDELREIWLFNREELF